MQGFFYVFYYTSRYTKELFNTMPDAYDASRKLITDPSLEQSMVMGGASKVGLGRERFEELRQEAADRELVELEKRQQIRAATSEPTEITTDDSEKAANAQAFLEDYKEKFKYLDYS